MSHTVAITKLQDGPRHVVFHVYIKGDGLSDDLAGAVLLDPSTSLSPAEPGKPVFTLEKLQYSLDGFSAALAFDYLHEDTALWVLTGGQDTEVCFKSYGGLKDRSNALDGTGKLLISTAGLVNGAGTIVLHLRKD